MNWIKAAFRAAGQFIKDSSSRVARFFAGCARNALKRWWVIPIAAGVTAAISLLSPMFAATLVAVVVNDPEGHQLWRMALDIGAVSGAVLLVSFVPILVFPIAMLPIADVMNRWVDAVIYHYRGDYEAEESRHRRAKGKLRGSPCPAEG